MKRSALSPLLPRSVTLAASVLLLAGCNSGNVPRDLMLEEAANARPIERPVAMRGETAFLDGKVAAVATVTRGFDRGPGARRAGLRPEDMEIGGRKRKEDAGAFSEVYNIGGYGDSEEDQKEAFAEYMRVAKARRAAGSPMPPVTLRVQFENKGATPMELEVTEVNSFLGNFAVRPPKLTLAPGEKGVLDPMISQLGVTSDEIELRLEVRHAGKKETKIVLVKNVIADSVRKEIDAATK